MRNIIKISVFIVFLFTSLIFSGNINHSCAANANTCSDGKESGICFYNSNTSPYYTTDSTAACQLLCHSGTLPTCSEMANGTGRGPNYHGISDSNVACSPGIGAVVKCCAPNTQPTLTPTPTPVKPRINKCGDGKETGTCYYNTNFPPYYTTDETNSCQIACHSGSLPNCSDMQANTHGISDSVTHCAGALGAVLKCCAPNTTQSAPASTSTPVPAAPISSGNPVTSTNLNVTQVSGITIPSGLSCVGVDERPFTSANYAAQGGAGAKLHPNPDTEGSENSQAWPRMTTDAGGCVKTWCDSGNVYANLAWPPGYTDNTARGKYTMTLWMSDTRKGSLSEPGYSGSQPNQTLKFQPGDKGALVVADIANGYGERGWTFTAFHLADCSAPAPTATPIPQPTDVTPGATAGNANITVKPDILDVIDAEAGRVPNHKRRHFTLFLYNNENYKNDTTGDDAAYNITGDIFFGKGNPDDATTYGTYTNATFPLTNVAAGDYYVFGRTEGSLRESLTETPTKIHIDPATGVTLDFTQGNTQIMPMGDLVGSDNTIGVDDYNAIYTCYGNKWGQADCQNLHLTDDIFTTVPYVDLNDDGKIDGIDYNIFARNFLRNNSGL